MEVEALLESAEPKAGALWQDDFIADEFPFWGAPWYEKVPDNMAQEEDRKKRHGNTIPRRRLARGEQV